MERTIHFRENWLIFWGIWGEAELTLWIWGAKEKYFQGAEEFSFRDLVRSIHYLQRSREHRPPPLGGGGGGVAHKTKISITQQMALIFEVF